MQKTFSLLIVRIPVPIGIIRIDFEKRRVDNKKGGENAGREKETEKVPKNLMYRVIMHRIDVISCRAA